MSKNIESVSTLRLLKGIWEQITKKRKIQLTLLVLLMLLSGVMEIISLASVIPFLGVLISPDSLQENKLLRNLFAIFNFEISTYSLSLFTFLFCFAIFVSALIRLLNIWFSNRLSAAIGSDLSSKCYASILFQPLIKIKNNSTSKIINSSITELNQTVAVINQTLLLITSLIVGLSILSTIFFINVRISIICFVFIFFIYLIIVLKSRKIFNKNSQFIATVQEDQVRFYQDALGGIRDIIINQNYYYFLNLFNKKDLFMRRKIAQNNFYSLFPRYIIESSGIILIAIISFFAVTFNNNSTNFIPLLGVFALGAQRMLPAFQQVYISWSRIRALSYSVKNVLKILDQPRILKYKIESKSDILVNRNYFKEIKIKNLSYKYEGSKNDVLRSINLEIKNGEFVGLMGPSGSGKSTLIDIILGLLAPINGDVLINKKNLYDKKNPNVLKKWHKLVSHVPQNIFISNQSIAENIAFGIPKHLINYQRVYKVAKIAKLIDFINSREGGIDSKVGEFGSKISGGQKQRIGIARALYKNPSFLVFDESTSALDEKNEKIILESINNLKGKLTILMISHNEKILSNCDKLFNLKRGYLR